jgi:hypothetical protein
MYLHSFRTGNIFFMKLRSDSSFFFHLIFLGQKSLYGKDIHDFYFHSIIAHVVFAFEIDGSFRNTSTERRESLFAIFKRFVKEERGDREGEGEGEEEREKEREKEREY